MMKMSMLVVVGLTLVSSPVFAARVTRHCVGKDKKEIAWGSQIRSYVLQPYQMVKDHRTGIEIGNTNAVLDGDIDAFIQAYLMGERRDDTPTASA